MLIHLPLLNPKQVSNLLFMFFIYLASDNSSATIEAVNSSGLGKFGIGLIVTFSIICAITILLLVGGFVFGRIRAKRNLESSIQFAEY